MDKTVDLRELKTVWTDPRTGTEYEIQSKRLIRDDAPWPGYVYLVTNLKTGERASFPFESMEGVLEILTRIVDEAEGLIGSRSQRKRAGWRMGGGSRVWGRVVRRARAFASGAQPERHPRRSGDNGPLVVAWGRGHGKANSKPAPTAPEAVAKNRRQA